jgi:glucose-6-phosphate-specific signal transduction histidine kinase
LPASIAGAQRMIVISRRRIFGLKQELEAKLAKCRDLARQFNYGVTAKNLRELADEIEQDIRASAQTPPHRLASF